MPQQPNLHHPNQAARRGRQGAQQQPRRPKVAGLRLRSSSAPTAEPAQDNSAQPQDSAATEVFAQPEVGVDEVRAEAGQATPAAGDTSGGQESEAAVADFGQQSAGQARHALLGGYAVPVALVVLAAVFAGLAVWFGGAADSLSAGGAAQNKALVDVAATSEVVGQVTTAVQTVFSYDFADTAKTETAANNLLAGKAVDEYQKLFAQVREQAPQQKLVVTTTVKSVGVKVLNGNTAQLLVFADQNAVRTDTSASNVGAAQFTVTAQRTNGHWQLTDIVLR